RMIATDKTRANAMAFLMALRGSERGRTLAHRRAGFRALHLGSLPAGGDPRPAHARSGANPRRSRERGPDDRGPHPPHRVRPEERADHLRSLLDDGAPLEPRVVHLSTRA